MTDVSTFRIRVRTVSGSVDPAVAAHYVKTNGGMMDRRQFLVSSGLKLAGVVAASSAFSTMSAMPVAAATLNSAQAAPIRTLVAPPSVSVTHLTMREPGTYQVSGLVRLEAPTVEISGIANSKQISWSGVGTQVVPFTSFEIRESAEIGRQPAITVWGGRLEQLSVTRIDFV
jgi:hypothetical protein